jgi:hypothetical protein
MPLIVDNKNGIYTTGDGVTGGLVNGRYPDPSPSYLVAKTFL